MHLHSLPVKIALVAAVAIATVFGIGTYFLARSAGSVIDSQNTEIQNTIAFSQALDVSKKLDLAARVAENIATTSAALKSKGMVDRAVLDEMLKGILEKNTDLLGVWTGWEPQALDGRDHEFVNAPGHDATGRFVPYWNRPGEKIVREPLVDYDKPETGTYYQVPLKANRAVAIEPYLYPVGGKEVVISSFSVPIVVGGRTVGIGGVDINLQSLNETMQQIKPFGTGFVSLISREGVAVAHPNGASIGKSLSDFDAASAAASRQAIETNSVVSIDGAGSDGAMWRFHATPIAAGNTADSWALVVAVPIATLEATISQTKASMYALSAASIVIVAGLLFLALTVLVGRPLAALGVSFDRMAGGDLDTQVPGAERSDEVGDIGKAVLRLRDSLQDKARREAEEKASRDAAAAAERKSEMRRMADAFQQAIGGIVGTVSSAASQLETAADSLTKTADRRRRGCALLNNYFYLCFFLIDLTTSIRGRFAICGENSQNPCPWRRAGGPLLALLQLADSLAGVVALGAGPAAVAPFDGRLEAVLLGVAPEPQALGVVPRDAVEEGREHLALLQPHVQHHLVDDHLVHRQMALRHAGDALGQRPRRALELVRGDGRVRQAPFGGGAPVDDVAGEHQLLGAHGAEPERPHRRRRAAPYPRRHVADAGILGDHDQVAAERDVAAARDGGAVDLGDGGLGAAPQAHEILGVALHRRIVDQRVPRMAFLLAGMIDHAFRGSGEVVTAAKALARAFDHDDVDVVVLLRPLDRPADFAGHLVGDGVEALGPVQDEAGDPRRGGVLGDRQGREIGHGLLRRDSQR